MKKKTTDFSDRMKEYEHVIDISLVKKIPVICRIDGVSFHTWTKGMLKPFDDEILLEAMRLTLKHLCEWTPGCVFGYTQSDEMTLVITDYETIQSSAFYDYRVQKLSTVIASRATMEFNRVFADLVVKFFNEKRSGGN